MSIKKEKPIRKIIHIDMDAFYAAIEQRDHPELKGKPVVVGGQPHSRGVVATCSYEARKYGIHSAMPSIQAYRLCPHAVFLRPRFHVYKGESQKIRSIFSQYTDLVEPLSLDEAFLDVTDNRKGIKSATRIAQKIRKQIYEELGLTASAGVSFNKFIAKVASDMHKPDGLTVIPPEKGELFIASLPIRKFFGVGRATEKKMLSLGIKTGADLRRHTREWLVDHFGKVGGFYFQICRGIDDRPVNPRRARKSMGKEKTLSRDLNDLVEIKGVLQRLAERLVPLITKADFKGNTLTLKIKYFDFQCISRSITLPHIITSKEQIMAQMGELLLKTEAGRKKIRLLGISVSQGSGKIGEKVDDGPLFASKQQDNCR